jgi:hypothetical protein
MINDRENVEWAVARAIYETHLGEAPPEILWENSSKPVRHWVLMQARSALRQLEDYGLLELEIN